MAGDDRRGMMFEKRETVYNITLPQPYPCRCGGTLFPVFRPTSLIVDKTLHGMPIGKEETVREGINEVVWKCDNCSKEIK